MVETREWEVGSGKRCGQSVRSGKRKQASGLESPLKTCQFYLEDRGRHRSKLQRLRSSNLSFRKLEKGAVWGMDSLGAGWRRVGQERSDEWVSWWPWGRTEGWLIPKAWTLMTVPELEGRSGEGWGVRPTSVLREPKYVVLRVWVYKKEWNNVICSNMNGPREGQTEWNKSEEIKYVLSLKCGI